MSEPPVDAASSDIRRAASQAVSQGVDIRALVHDVTLSALQLRRFDAQGFREVLRAVTEGVELGAEQGRSDMRSALSDAFGGLELLRVHRKPAVADRGHHRNLWPRQLRADRGAQSVRHG